MNILQKLFRKTPATISESDLRFWEANGYFVVRGAFSEKEIDAFNAFIDNLWANRTRQDNPLVIDFWEGELFGKRMYFRDAPDDSRSLVHKLNEVYLEMPECRNMSLAPVLISSLRSFLGGDPMIVNSLIFEKGSQQPDHYDTYHMPPPENGELAVSSICLEDVSADAGPVHVYPGTHRIPPYVFSHGGINLANPNERGKADEYARREIEARGISKTPFFGKKGDVLFWHGQTYHGGAEIKDHAKTRKTLVTHYWRECEFQNKERVIPHGKNSYYLKRKHTKPW